MNRLVGNQAVTLRWSEETHKLIGDPSEVEVKQRSLCREEKFSPLSIGASHWIIEGDENAWG
jgi:hypothetical protein